jgi:hypothetical protein
LQYDAHTGFVDLASHLTRAPPMSISMLLAHARDAGGRDIGAAVVRGIGDSIVTGNSTGLARGVGACPCSRKCSRRHLNSQFALMPLSSAMPDTDAPG